jgi:hypothetical protein
MIDIQREQRHWRFFVQPVLLCSLLAAIIELIIGRYKQPIKAQKIDINVLDDNL